MIAEVAFVPSAPVLLREYRGGVDVGLALRSISRLALSEALATGVDEVCVVDGVDPSRVPARGSLGWRVARELLAEVDWRGEVAWSHVPVDAAMDGEVAELGEDLATRDGRVLLLVVGDGSPKRGEKAPGHLDERSFAVDEQWVNALRTGDIEALLALDADLCGELLVTGRAAWQVAATAVRADGGRIEPRLLDAGDPWGVMYAVARWSLSRP